MRLATLWLVVSAETFRVHGASAAAQGAKGVQGRNSPKSKVLSKKEQRAAAAAAKEVCSVNDSAATCRELTAKYRGGGEYLPLFRNGRSVLHPCSLLTPRLRMSFDRTAVFLWGLHLGGRI